MPTPKLDPATLREAAEMVRERAESVSDRITLVVLNTLRISLRHKADEEEQSDDS